MPSAWTWLDSKSLVFFLLDPTPLVVLTTKPITILKMKQSLSVYGGRLYRRNFILYKIKFVSIIMPTVSFRYLCYLDNNFFENNDYLKRKKNDIGTF